VYLFRGVFNVSVGLDALAAKLVRLGVAASVYGYGEYGSVASDVVRDYKSGKVRTIILIGHSFGGRRRPVDGGYAQQCERSGRAADLARLQLERPCFRATSGGLSISISRGRARRLIPGAGFHSSLQNIDVKKHSRHGPHGDPVDALDAPADDRLCERGAGRLRAAADSSPDICPRDFGVGSIEYARGANAGRPPGRRNCFDHRNAHPWSGSGQSRTSVPRSLTVAAIYPICRRRSLFHLSQS